MTQEKLRGLSEEYKDYAHKKSQESDAPYCGYYLKIQSLCTRALGRAGLIDEGRIEKAMRWLGFIQGVLWSIGDFTVDELRTHSRSEENEVSSE